MDPLSIYMVIIHVKRKNIFYHIVTCNTWKTCSIVDIKYCNKKQETMNVDPVKQHDSIYDKMYSKFF